jgi:electron transfer flavoprotein alpha subunit
MSTILVVTEILEGEIRSVNHQVYTAAVQMGRATGQPVVALLVGGGALETLAEVPAAYGIAKTVVVEDPALARYSPDGYAAVVAQAARAQDAGVVLMGATVTGKDLMARVAYLLDTALAQDCVSFRVDGGAVLFIRPLFAGKVLAEVRVTARPVLATLRPKAYKAEEAPGAGTVERLRVDLPEPLAVVEARTRSASEQLDVTEADIVVSGGRGLQGPEHWGVLEALVEALGEGATLGCSRPVSDDGWRPHDEHVGQTGKTVAPDLYIACGISGAIQHVAGITASKFIVAVNKDPDAPIFNVADYGLVGDLFEVVPALTEAVKALKAGD